MRQGKMDKFFNPLELLSNTPVSLAAVSDMSGASPLSCSQCTRQ